MCIDQYRGLRRTLYAACSTSLGARMIISSIYMVRNREIEDCRIFMYTKSMANAEKSSDSREA